MGVSRLWDLLAPCGRRVSLESLSRKRLAVDASIWLIQFIKAMRDDSGEMLQNAPVLGLFRRLCKLLFLHIYPVLVFDGATPPLKQKTVARRRAFRERQESSLRRTAEKILLNQVSTSTLAQTRTHTRTHATTQPRTHMHTHARTCVRAHGFLAPATRRHRCVQMKGRHLLHGLVADTSAGPAAAPPASAPASAPVPMDEDGIGAALDDQFGEQDAVVDGLSSGAAQAAQPTAAQPGASNSTSSAGGKARVAEHVDVDAEDHEDTHAAAGSSGGRPAYLNDGPATRVQADGLTLRDFVQRAAAKRNPNAHWRGAIGEGASSEMLGSVIVPRYAENKVAQTSASWLSRGLFSA